MENLEKLIEFIREQAKLGYVPSFILLYNPTVDDNAVLFPEATVDPLAKAVMHYVRQVVDADATAFVIPGTGGPRTVQ